MWKWTKRHPVLSTLFSIFIINLPQWVDSVWSLAEKTGGVHIAMPNIIWTYWLTVPLGIIMFAITLWAIRSNRKDVLSERFLEATRNADPAIALKDMALKAAEIAEGIKDEVDKDSMNLTSKILTHDYVTLMKQRLQPSGNEGKPYSINWKEGRWKLRLEGWDNPSWENETGGRSLLLEGWIGISILEPIRIESIVLTLAGDKYPCAWESTEFFISEEHDIACDIPLNTPRGKQTAYLTAIVNGEPYKSKTFTLDLPKGKPIPDKEDSQN